MKSYKWPALYKRSKTGKITKWEIWTGEEKCVSCIYRENGFIDGKRNVKRQLVKNGTNIGKTNEKTPAQHAHFLARRYYKKQIRQNFVVCLKDVDNPPKFIYPMLAEKYSTLMKRNKHHDIFPIYAQPKLNGVRGWKEPIRTPSKGLISRELHTFPGTAHIDKAVEEIFGDIPPDGEIYKKENFQQLIRWVKKYRKGLSENLEYWVYDIAVPGMILEERMKWLEENIPQNHPIIKKVPTIIVNDHEQFKLIHDHWSLIDGFEGIMGRKPGSFYGFNERTTDLLKWKYFQDEEFLIVGAEPEEWHDTTHDVIRTLVVWVCETEEENRFTCRPKGSMMKREQMWKTKEKYFGKELTIRFQEKSEDNVPIFGVGICVRDYE